MSAGKRNKRVKLQQLPAGQDAIGQPVQPWSDVVTVWAEIIFQSGTEAIKADATTSIVKTIIRIGYRTGINAGMRVLHGATAYNITAVLPDVAGKTRVDLACEAAT